MRSTKSTIIVGALLMAFGLTSTGFCFQANNLPTNLPSLPDAVTRVPNWIDKNDVPFDVASYLKADSPGRNAATYYLLGMQYFSPTMGKCFRSQEESIGNAAALNFEDINYYHENFSLLRRFADITYKQDLITRLRPGFQRITEAQQTSQCKFRCGLSLQQPHYTAAKMVAKALAIKTSVDMNDKKTEEALNNVDVALKMARDLIPNANIEAMMAVFEIEDIVCRRMIPQILMEKFETSPSFCDRLIQALYEHRAATQTAFKSILAAEWMRLYSQAKQGKVSFDAQSAAIKDLRQWFNLSYAALDAPPRELARDLNRIFDQTTANHKNVYQCFSLGELVKMKSVFDTHLDVTMGLCAVRRRYMTSTKRPNSIDEVFEESYLKETPLDNMRLNARSKQYLKGIFYGDEAYIYSIGPNGQDDVKTEPSDDMTVHIETGAAMEFRYDPFERFRAYLAK